MRLFHEVRCCPNGSAEDARQQCNNCRMNPQAVVNVCSELLAQVLRLEQPADAAAAQFFRARHALGRRDRAMLADAVYAVLRCRRWFEARAATVDGPAQVRRLAILALVQTGALAEAQLAAEDAAWLGSCAAVDDGVDALRHNLPDWLALDLERQLGHAEMMALAQSLLQPAPLDVRVNVLKARRPQVQAALAQAGIESRPTPWSPWGLRIQGKPALTRLDVHEQGVIEVQDEGSQLLTLLTGAARGEMVADFCAGAGGKTLGLGAAMRNTGRLYAFDTSAHRLQALKPRLQRSGLDNVHTVAVAHGDDQRLARLHGKMDRVLVDAPCSGTGTLRRSPDIKWRQTPQTVEALVRTQSAILRSAARLLKPGGTLVYATCSLLEQENEAQAQAFTGEIPSFEPAEAVALMTRCKVENAQALCSGGAGGQYLRLWPHRHGTDGFFAAVWRRKG